MPARAFFACFTFSTFAFIMNEELDPNIENLSEEEIVFEQVLRPKQFDDFFGQEQIVENLKIKILIFVEKVKISFHFLISL